MKFELEFDEDKLGKNWMNIHNLEMLLYSTDHVARNVITVREL